MKARLSLCLTSAGFIIATNAAPPDPTLPVYRLFSADRKRNEWRSRVRTGIGKPQSLPTTESSTRNINATTHLPQHDGPRIAMISGGWIFSKDRLWLQEWRAWCSIMESLGMACGIL